MYLEYAVKSCFTMRTYALTGGKFPREVRAVEARDSGSIPDINSMGLVWYESGKADNGDHWGRVRISASPLERFVYP